MKLQVPTPRPRITTASRCTLRTKRIISWQENSSCSATSTPGYVKPLLKTGGTQFVNHTRELGENGRAVTAAQVFPSEDHHCGIMSFSTNTVTLNDPIVIELSAQNKPRSLSKNYQTVQFPTDASLVLWYSFLTKVFTNPHVCRFLQRTWPCVGAEALSTHNERTRKRRRHLHGD